MCVCVCAVSMDRERWLGLQWGPEDDPGEGKRAGVFGLSGADTEELQEKLLNLRAELRKLNESGSRLVFVSSAHPVFKCACCF